MRTAAQREARMQKLREKLHRAQPPEEAPPVPVVKKKRKPQSAKQKALRRRMYWYRKYAEERLRLDILPRYIRPNHCLSSSLNPQRWPIKVAMLGTVKTFRRRW